MKLYVSSKNETPRMFENNFLEVFSKVHWTVPLWLFIPIISYLLYVAVTIYNIGLPRLAGLVLAGVAFWTLAEYTLHRFLFHYHAKSKIGQRLIWMFHGIHHDYPNDALRLVMPPSVSLPLAAMFYFLFVAVMGFALTSAFMAGFLSGYLVYDMTHFAIHHFPLKGKIWGANREHHLRHHFKSPNHGFGVSSPFWDVVFGTRIRDEEAEPTQHGRS
jgi:sterol desaturase/sphingolipid hydroxylase (fatty acid hydroxylase superfamily)